MASLRPEFQQQIVSLKQKVQQNLVSKVVNGQVVRGRQFVQLVENVLTQFNKNAVPNIKSEFELIMRHEIDGIRNEVIARVKESIGKQDLSQPGALAEIFPQAWKATVEITERNLQQSAVAEVF